MRELTTEQILELFRLKDELILINSNKSKAVKNQRYEIAVQLRDSEKFVIEKIYNKKISEMPWQEVEVGYVIKYVDSYRGILRNRKISILFNE